MNHIAGFEFPFQTAGSGVQRVNVAIAAAKIGLTAGNDRRRDNLPSGMRLFHQGSLRHCIDGREREMSLFLYLYPVRNESFAERQAHGTKQLNLSTDRQNLIVCGAMK